MAHGTVTDEDWTRFHGEVNMTSRELREWLAVDEEDARGGDGELDDLDGGAPAYADDRALGHRVVDILAKRRGDLTPDDVDVMTRVTSRIARLRAEFPEEPAAGPTRRRHRLMSLGHDPLKAG